MKEPEYGETYYQITFADPKLTMPGLKPLVYLGKNIFDSDTEDAYYFQDTISVLIFGRLDEAHETENCKVSSFKEEDFGVTIASPEEAVTIFKGAVQKAKLQKAEGDWTQQP